jgi:hypothetical protein
VRSKGRRAWWVAAEEQRPEIHWEQDFERDVARSAVPVDLHRRVGLKLWVCESDGRTRLWIESHHSCSDGLGLVRFAEDLLAAYAAEREGGEPKLRPLDADRLRDRGVYARSRVAGWLRWPFEVLCIAGSAEYFLHRPVPLALPGTESVDDGEPSPRFAAYRHQFTADETAALRRAARAEKATLNDVLLRDLFLASQDWIERHRADDRTGLVRIMVPISLRTRLHAEMPAADCVCMVNIDRRVPRWNDPVKMLRVVSAEMGWVKRLRLGVVMLRIFELLQLVLGSLKAVIPADRCLASCVLSNLGRPVADWELADAEGRVRAADVELVEIELLPPVRPLTSAAFGAATLAGRLTTSLLADRRALGPDGGEELLGLYIARLRETARTESSEAAEGSPPETVSPST